MSMIGLSISSYSGSAHRTVASRSSSDATDASPASRPRSATSCSSAATSARNGARVATGSALAASSSAAMRGLFFSLAQSRAVRPAMSFAAGSHPAPSSTPARDGSSGPNHAAWCSAVYPYLSLAVASAPAATSSRTPPTAAPSGCAHFAARCSGVRSCRSRSASAAATQTRCG